MLHVLFAGGGLLRQTIELRTKDGSLKFAEAIIKTDDAVMELVCKAGAAGVDITLHAFYVFQIVGNDDSAFAAGDELAGLKAEGANIAHGACTFAVPHAAVRMCAILNHL